MQLRWQLVSMFLCIWITAAGCPIARAEAGRDRLTATPDYKAAEYCARTAPQTAKSTADCLATELSFRWALSRAWPQLVGLDRDQAEICMNSVDYQLPETGSFRALAECVAGLSNVNE